MPLLTFHTWAEALGLKATMSMMQSYKQKGRTPDMHQKLRETLAPSTSTSTYRYLCRPGRHHIGSKPPALGEDRRTLDLPE